MQASTLLQTDNHTSTPPLSFLQAGCPSCRPTNSVKALKESYDVTHDISVLITFATVEVIWLYALVSDQILALTHVLHIN